MAEIWADGVRFDGNVGVRGCCHTDGLSGSCLGQLVVVFKGGAFDGGQALDGDGKVFSRRQFYPWQWAQRRWQHTREWSATWGFHLDGRKQAEVILPHDQANPPSTDNMCPVSAIHQIRASAGGKVSAAIHREEEAPAAHAALVRDIFAALRITHVRPPGNPAMPGPTTGHNPDCPQDVQITKTATVQHRPPHGPRAARKAQPMKPRTRPPTGFGQQRGTFKTASTQPDQLRAGAPNMKIWYMPVRYR